MSTRTRTARIRSVEPLEGFVLRLGFDDGTMRELDLEAELWGPVFEPLRHDPQLFGRYASTTSSERSCGQTAPTWTPTYSTATLRQRLGSAPSSDASFLDGRAVTANRPAMTRKVVLKVELFPPDG